MHFSCCLLTSISGSLRWYQFPDRSESIFEDQADDVTSILILRNQLDCNSSPETLTIYNDFGILHCIVLPDVIKRSLGVNHETFFIGRSSRETVTTILGHEYVASGILQQDFRDWNSVSNISGITVEH